MKKIAYLLVLLIFILGFGLTGCDNNHSDNIENEDIVTPDETTYTLNVIVGDGGSANITKKECKSGELIELFATPKTGYRVKGWYSKDNVLLSEENSYSFIIRNDTVIVLEFLKQIVIDATGEYSDDSEISGVGKNFAILVECPEANAVEYIRQNLHIYDEYFLDDDNKVYEGYEAYAEVKLGKIESRGNNMYLVYPEEDYSKSGAYVIQSKNNVTVYKKGI